MASSDSTRPASDVALFGAASPIASTDTQTTSENVKNLKRKVISVTKLMEVFKNKEQETASLKMQLEQARKEADALREQSKTEPASAELGRLREMAEQSRIAAEQAKAGQKAAEENLAKQMQKLKATEMLNTQLEAKGNNFDQLRSELVEAQKKFASTQKELEQAVRKSKQESSDLRAKLMKVDAEKADRLEWLGEQRKRWEKDEERRQGNRTQELQEKIKELEHQLEDMGTERYLELELAREEQKSAEDRLKTAYTKLEDANAKIKSLNHTVLDLRAQNGTLERKISSLERDIDALELRLSTHDHDSAAQEVFEEVIPEQNTASVATSAQRERTSIEWPLPSQGDTKLSGDRLDEALRAINDLKTQFTVLRMFPDSQDDQNRISVLLEKVKTLTQEKEVLQHELTRRLVERPTQEPFNTDTHVSLIAPFPTTLTKDSMKATGQVGTFSAPISSDTIPRSDASVPPTSPKKLGRKRKAVEVTADTFIEPDTHSSEEPGQDIEPDTLDRAASEGITSIQAARKPGRPARTPATPASSIIPKTKKARASKKPARTLSVDLSRIQIRNISVNPLVPSIIAPRQFFSSLMNSAIIEDSQPYTKLDAIAAILPAGMGDLFEAVADKAKEISAKVSDFRTKHNMLQDSTKTWTLDDFQPIPISESLSPSEVYIVQLLCLLQARFPELDILHRFFAVAGEIILKGAAAGEQLDALSVLVRITTGTCRVQNDVQRPRILAYDILREIPTAKTSLVLCETIASIWPSVFMVADKSANEDHQRLILKAFQAVLGTYHEATKDTEPLLGYTTFAQKCSWPALADAPFVNELVDEMMTVVRSAEFPDMCRTLPGYEFTFRKALELLLVQGYEWVEIYNDFIKPDLFKLMIHESLHTFATPLVAAVTRETRLLPRGTAAHTSSSVDATPIRELLEAILESEAQLCHQSLSALAIVELSYGKEEHLSKAQTWHGSLSTSDKSALPKVLQEILS
ncbi:hypothetical protein EDD11_007849 [Mortierella claussenii]|nr:hypothetical protein EDD11_007849 [Mortierella claussenii]